MIIHAKGPWEVSNLGNDYDQHMIFAATGELVANTVQGAANAKLIALAPTMLEQIRECAEQTGYNFSVLGEFK